MHFLELFDIQVLFLFYLSKMSLPQSFKHFECGNRIYRANILEENDIKRWIEEYSAITYTNCIILYANERATIIRLS